MPVKKSGTSIAITESTNPGTQMKAAAPTSRERKVAKSASVYFLEPAREAVGLASTNLATNNDSSNLSARSRLSSWESLMSNR